MRKQEFPEKNQSRDPGSFREIFETYHPMVFRICMHFLGTTQEAEDVTQDIFFQAYKSLDKFRLESKISTWLYRITVNHCLNHQKRKKIISWLSLDFLLDTNDNRLQNTCDSAKSQIEHLENQEMKSSVLEAIQSLPDQQRTALILSVYEEMSYKKIAEIMKGSVSKVESLLFRSKRNLAKKLIKILEKEK